MGGEGVWWGDGDGDAEVGGVFLSVYIWWVIELNGGSSVPGVTVFCADAPSCELAL